MKIIGILLAAGEGTRTKLKVPKQIYQVENMFLFEHALNTIIKSKCCNEIILVVSASTYKIIDRIIRNRYKKYQIHIILGGKTRQESTKRAIKYIIKKNLTCNIALFHDAVRTLIPAVDFKRVASMSTRKDGSIFTETIRGSIPISIKRDKIIKYNKGFPYVTHTPECYNFKQISEIYLTPKIPYSKKMTNLELMLLHKKTIVPVFSNNLNFKVTFPEDIVFVKKHLSKV